MTVQLPAPHDGAQSADSTADATRRKQADQATGRPLPTNEQIYGMLMGLNGLVMMRIITPAQANVIQRNLAKILDDRHKCHRAERPLLSQETLADLCRQSPQVIALVEPFLTQEQLAFLMGVKE
jgi:hypothetical protein